MAKFAQLNDAAVKLDAEISRQADSCTHIRRLLDSFVYHLFCKPKQIRQVYECEYLLIPVSYCMCMHTHTCAHIFIIHIYVYLYVIFMVVYPPIIFHEKDPAGQ